MNSCATAYRVHDIRDLARELYGLDLASDPERLYGTGDDIFLLRAGEKFILRIAIADETLANLAFQNEVLGRLSRRSLGFALPEIVPSAEGRETETVAFAFGSRLVRLCTYVPGHSVSSITPSAALLEEVGRSLAALDLALSDIPCRPPPQKLVWSIATALDLRPHIDLLASPATRALLKAAFDNFERRVLPLMGRLRHQIIHGDFNANNVLIASPDSGRVAGVIDFGDLTFGPLVNDLAVAAARHCIPEDPLPGILALCSGYGSKARLLPEEADALFDLICLRAAMRIAYWASQAARLGERLGAEIEEPAAATLAFLLETDAREHVSRCVRT